MASSMMDFLMLALVVGGGAFIWINKECIMAGTCFGGGGGVDCTKTPNDPSCTGGNGGGGTDDATCQSKYNGSCNSECGDGKSCGASACKACNQACGDSKTPTACRGGGTSGGGGSQGQQCGDLCNRGNCATYYNQCTAGCSGSGTPCSKCESQLQSLSRQIVNASPAGYHIGCGGCSNGYRTCSLCKTCTNGTELCSASLKMGTYWSVSGMVQALKNSYNSKHPNGCGGVSGGCNRTCGGGWVLNTKSCTCECTPSLRGCTGSSSCTLKTNSTCKCLNAGTGVTGSSSGCNSGYYRCRNSSGYCSCCKKPTSGGGGGGGPQCCQGSSCYSGCNGLTGNTWYSCCCGWRGSHGGCGSGQKGVYNGSGGCNCVSAYTQVHGLRGVVNPSAMLARTPRPVYKVNLG